MINNKFNFNQDIEPWTFKVSLALEAHSLGQRFQGYQSTPEKAKQVYLNTLAVYAVNIYLQCRGFETDLEQSWSWEPAMQILMDTADLEVKNYGKLECRPVLPEAKILYIPEETWADRIAYVAVQLTESLREATVLGFVDKASSSEIPLSQLRSLGELPGYLNQLKPLVDLSQWFEDIFEAGWQAIETLLTPESTELALSFRNTRQTDICRCKFIELGERNQSVVMIITLTEASEQDREISVEVQSPTEQIYLPANLQLMLLNEEQEVVMDVQAGSENHKIQLEFVGETGDFFCVKVVLGNVSITENFVI